MTRANKQVLVKTISYILLILLTAATLMPLLWMLSASLKTNTEVFSANFRWIPGVFQWNNYLKIWSKIPLATFTLNTVKLTVLITVILYGRMIEIYLYTSLAPIPFATMSNREWGHVGTNYFRGLFALAFQAFLMMVCVAIYAALIGSIRVSSDIHSALFGTMAYTVILCFSLLKTGSLSKQIFGSH